MEIDNDHVKNILGISEYELINIENKNQFLKITNNEIYFVNKSSPNNNLTQIGNFYISSINELKNNVKLQCLSNKINKKVYPLL